MNKCELELSQYAGGAEAVPPLESLPATKAEAIPARHCGGVVAVRASSVGSKDTGVQIAPPANVLF